MLEHLSHGSYFSPIMALIETEKQPKVGKQFSTTTDDGNEQ